MNDEQFEKDVERIEWLGFPGLATAIRNHNTVQREALARVEAELDTERSRSNALVQLHNNGTWEIAQAQLVQAVGLLGQLYDTAFNSVELPEKLNNSVLEFLACHDQAEQQEAQGVYTQPKAYTSTEAERQGTQAVDDYQLTPEEIAERQAFNKWRVDGIDGCNCSPAAAAWLAWQARAALATQSAVPAQWRIDEVALDAAKAIMGMFAAPLPIGGECQRQAQIQCLLIDMIHTTQPAYYHDMVEAVDVLEALADGYERGYQDGQSNPSGYNDKLAKHRVAAELLAAVRGAEHE